MLDGNNTKLGYSLVVYLVTSMEEDSYLEWKKIYSQRSDCYKKKNLKKFSYFEITGNK
jgi:hypothetical protein